MSAQASVLISYLVTGLFLLGWMVFGFVHYRRTGNATWLWLGVLMGVSLVSAFLGIARFYA